MSKCSCNDKCNGKRGCLTETEVILDESIIDSDELKEEVDNLMFKVLPSNTSIRVANKLSKMVQELIIKNYRNLK